ncbi:protein NBR1-like protein [Iris pallida]|uniref:Protein NBR1-like protein n=1 Tax=Iris pallida TaxID=29817 RepID=A0AAX6FE55_IRIPA|nr:protein NBR1-like protein [Iris pallida]
MARPITSSPLPAMDPPFDRRDLVIKVKHGDTLRRIGAYVNGQFMDQNMSILRAKIISLFKFNPDADFILTYTDEDGDIVTLDDDDELRDAVIGQHLNPLRINVQLRTNTAASTDARSEAASPTAAKPPKAPLNIQSNIQSGVNEALKSVPEPFRSAITDLSGDVLKVATSTPAFVKLVESFSKLGLSNVSQPFQGTTGESSGGSSGVSAHPVDLNVGDEPQGSSVPTQETGTTVSVGTARENHESGNRVQDSGPASSASVDSNQDITKNKNVPLYPFDDLLVSIWNADGPLMKEGGNAPRDGKSVATSTFGAPIQLIPIHDTTGPPKSQIGGSSHADGRLIYEKEGGNAPRDGKSIATSTFGAPIQLIPIHDRYADMISGSSAEQLPGKTTGPPTSQIGGSSHSDAPMNSLRFGSVPPSTYVHPPTYVPQIPPANLSYPPLYQRSHSNHENAERTFHKGIQCDACGMHPIIGPRFKSKVKDDYDLCNFCFSQMGDEADYMRIDRPVHRTPRLSKEFHSLNSKYRFHSSNVSHGYGSRSRVKLESRFIQDVTVLDGTMMAPSTHFTKIWRMRNNGTVAWPFGTQLVWVGGDQFGEVGSTELEIPADGFPVEGELDIAVDFMAPSRPGRYVSYWRMSSPSGQKFGQRVWVLIQVEYSRPNTPGSSAHPVLNLNLPPESDDRSGLGIIDMNVQPSDGGFPEANITCPTEGVVKPVSVEQAAELVGGLLDSSNHGINQSSPAAVAPLTTSYPLIDFPSASSPLVAPPFVPSADHENQVEQTLLKELEEMGFKQIDLNKEILRLNEYDLEQCVDDLCGFAEWDPLLAELQEMGFYDKELNKKLLIKNGGSIKRTVLDLVAGVK